MNILDIIKETLESENLSDLNLNSQLDFNLFEGTGFKVRRKRKD